ncbi:hypothetical protein ACAW74_02910 [Fibrella sp. WM1]|uniref:hypothetical protein n=1 Tax=Fibrella musci TaxID=3242485 RepID=UPI003520C4D8
MSSDKPQPIYRRGRPTKPALRRLVVLFCVCWLGLTTAALAQQTDSTRRRPVRKIPRSTRVRTRRPLPPAYTPRLNRRGQVRRLSPEQLWDAKPDSTHPNRGPFRLLVYTSLGGSIYMPAIGTPGTLADERKIRLGLPLTARVMWQTDHRLRLGIETGYLDMYSYRGTINGEPARVRLSAVPVLAVFSMSVVRRFALYAGTGPYIVNSELSYDGNTRGHTFSIGWMVAGTYTQPITHNLGLAAELKWYDATQTNDACMLFQATLVWRALTW